MFYAAPLPHQSGLRPASFPGGEAFVPGFGVPWFIGNGSGLSRAERHIGRSLRFRWEGHVFNRGILRTGGMALCVIGTMGAKVNLPSLTVGNGLCAVPLRCNYNPCGQNGTTPRSCHSERTNVSRGIFPSGRFYLVVVHSPTWWIPPLRLRCGRNDNDATFLRIRLLFLERFTSYRPPHQSGLRPAASRSEKPSPVGGLGYVFWTLFFSHCHRIRKPMPAAIQEEI